VRNARRGGGGAANNTTVPSGTIAGDIQCGHLTRSAKERDLSDVKECFSDIGVEPFRDDQRAADRCLPGRQIRTRCGHETGTIDVESAFVFG
jgi:hypothetical protein